MGFPQYFKLKNGQLYQCLLLEFDVEINAYALYRLIRWIPFHFILHITNGFCLTFQSIQLHEYFRLPCKNLYLVYTIWGSHFVATACRCINLLSFIQSRHLWLSQDICTIDPRLKEEEFSCLYVISKVSEKKR